MKSANSPYNTCKPIISKGKDGKIECAFCGGEMIPGPDTTLLCNSLPIISDKDRTVIQAERIAKEAAQNWGFRDVNGQYLNTPDGVKTGQAMYCYYDPDELLVMVKAGSLEAYKGLQALTALHVNCAPTGIPAAIKEFTNWTFENDPPKKGTARKLDAQVERKVVWDTIKRIEALGLATFGQQDASRDTKVEPSKNAKTATGIVAKTLGMSEKKSAKDIREYQTRVAKKLTLVSQRRKT